MHRLFDFFLLALERINKYKILVFWTLIGLTAATTLSMSLLLYVDAVTSQVLANELDEEPYAFRFRYLGAWEGPITQEDVASTTATLNTNFVDTIALPVAQQIQFTGIGRWNLTREGRPAGSFVLGSLTGFEERVELVDGEWYGETDGETVAVMISEQMFYQTGIQVGDEISAAQPGSDPITLKIVGMWRPLIPNDTSWVLPAKFFEEVFLIAPDTMAALDTPIDEVDWQLVFDGENVRASEINGLITSIQDGERSMTSALPGIRLDVSPVQNMEAFNDEVQQLTQQLVIVVMPVAGLILYFVAMLAGMLVSQQGHEDVMLSSRGMSRWALVRLHALIWLILGSMAYGLGTLASPYVVELVGRTTTFMRFDDTQAVLDIQFTQQAILAGIGAAVLAGSSGIFIAWRTTRQTITGFKRQQARAAKAWWQRLYLDVMLLVPTGYVFYTLQAQGGLTTEATDPFADPLVFLAPTLFSLGMTLVFLRLLPVLSGILAWLLHFTSNAALLMAFRDLNRSMGRYRGTLLMMCFTLSLIGFTASMASTLDQSLKDVIEYRIGADSVLVVVADAQTETSTDASGGATVDILGYNTLPASSLLDVEGVEGVSRVGEFSSQLILANQRVPGTVIGVDRWALPSIAYFRDDYADLPLADLMNLLATDRTGIIINAQTARNYNLVVGQQVTLQVNALESTYETTVPILGIIDYFPTKDPADGFFAITNIDPLFELVGTELPHDLWLNLADDANVATIQRDVYALGYPVLTWLNPAEALYETQTQPARRGVLGFLSIGFIASIFLTLISNLIQMVSSFRAQAVQLGALRAMGLRGISTLIYSMATQGTATLSGVLAGTGIGVGTTLLFLPLLDFSGGLPPYLIRVAWDDITLVYAVFAAALLGITFMTTLVMSRQQMTELVKLGDI